MATNWISRRHFDTMEELVATGKPGRIHDRRWAFGNSFGSEESTAAALIEGRAGSEVLAAIEQIRDSFNLDMEPAEASSMTRRRRRVWGEDGDEPSAERFLSGSESPWSRSVRGREARIIRIGVKLSNMFDFRPEDFAHLSATAAIAADALERLGYGVEVVGVFCSMAKPSRRWWLDTVTLKRSGDPLDVEKVASAGIPGLFRWIIGASFHWDPSAHGDNTSTSKMPPPDMNEAAGIDYLIGRYGYRQSGGEIMQGIRSILQEPAAC